MKIGLLTFSSAPNFGAFMQSVATTRFLSASRVQVQNFDPNTILFYTRNSIKPQSLIYKFQSRNFEFDRNAVGLTTRHLADIDPRLLSDIDAFFVGSDQVLNPRCYGKLGMKKSLSSLNVSTPKFGLAMSAHSVRDLEKLDEQELDCIKRFTRISFREAYLTDWMEKKVDVKAVTLPDPSFLLTRNDLNELCSYDDATSNPTPILIAGYDLHKWAKYLLDICPIKGEFRTSNSQWRQCIPWKISIRGPLESLRILLSSEIVITNSFHYAVVSIIAGKKVLIPSNISYDGGPRLKELTKAFNFRQLSQNAMLYEPSYECTQNIICKRNLVKKYITNCLKYSSKNSTHNFMKTK